MPTITLNKIHIAIGLTTYQEQEEALVDRLVKIIDGSARKEISSNKTKLCEYQNRMKTINQNIKILF